MRDDDINVPVTDEYGHVDQSRLLDRVVRELELTARCTPRLHANQLARLGSVLLTLEPRSIWTDTLNECDVGEWGHCIAELRAEGLTFDEGTRPGPDGRQYVVRHAINNRNPFQPSQLRLPRRDL